jgi:hypothetical protein
MLEFNPKSLYLFSDTLQAIAVGQGGSRCLAEFICTGE